MAEGGNRDSLDAAVIASAIQPEFRSLVTAIDVLDQTDSTNDELLRLPSRERHGRLLVAERQSAGKGRRGRRWQSPPGNIYLSFGWRFEKPDVTLAALGPAVGICVCRSLARFGLDGHGVKWPNDIVVDGAKLGGILVETHRGRTGCDAVIGIGINLRLPDRVSSAIEQPWTDLSGQAGFELPGRNALIAALVEELLSGIATSGRSLADFVGASWLRWDLLKGRDVRVERGGTMFSGKAMGITGGGALRLCVTPANGVGADGEFMEFHSGEVSVRHA